MKTFKVYSALDAKGGCDISPAQRSASSRLWIIDLLKLLAANLIVLHHLSAYGPVAQVMAEHCPRLMDWLYRDARIAVQVFLVTGGISLRPLFQVGLHRAIPRR